MITFVLPSFLRLIEKTDSQAEFPSLNKMLSKAQADVFDSESVIDNYYLVSRLFGVVENLGGAVAAVTEFGVTEKFSPLWSCCASPAIISPNRDHLDLEKIGGFKITADEAESFCEEFNDYFKEDGLSFSFQSPDQWYCYSENDFEVSVQSPFDIEGGNIAPYIPNGKTGAKWRKIFNEMQMLLHHSATNHKRTQLGKPEINSVWFWGGGGLNANSFDAYLNPELAVVSDDPYVKGLAKLTGAKLFSLDSKLAGSTSSDNHLIVTMLDEVNIDEWDKCFFSRALDLLRQGKIKNIVLYFEAGSTGDVGGVKGADGLEKAALEIDTDKHHKKYRRYTLNKTDLFKFWKTEKSISYFI